MSLHLLRQRHSLGLVVFRLTEDENEERTTPASCVACNSARACRAWGAHTGTRIVMNYPRSAESFKENPRRTRVPRTAVSHGSTPTSVNKGNSNGPPVPADGGRLHAIMLYGRRANHCNTAVYRSDDYTTVSSSPGRSDVLALWLWIVKRSSDLEALRSGTKKVNTTITMHSRPCIMNCRPPSL